MSDPIDRQEALHKINALIDEFETIMKDIRERHVDDSVCGLCEYDGAYIGESGNWCNECPGFDRDDCFKLKDQYREEWAGTIKNLPSVKPKRETTTLKIGRSMRGVTMWYECDACGEPVDQEDAFCRRCGRGIIHE